MHKRREFPRKVMAEAFLRANGHCEQCGLRLWPGRIAYDHRIADAMGGEPTLENCHVLCIECHRIKTRSDFGVIAKTKRVRANHWNARKFTRPMPGSRKSEWKKTFNFGWVKR